MVAEIFCTYRSVLPTVISASTLIEGDAFVSTQDETRVTHTALYTGLLTGTTGACWVLTARL